MAETVVILHGWGLSAERFSPLVAEFKNLGYRVLAPDFPGFGTSIIPKKPLTLPDYSDFLRQFLTANKAHNPILVGHSFGGRVSLEYQRMFPNSIRALVLSGTPGFTPIPRKKLLLFISLAKLGNALFSIPPLSLFQDDVRRWYYYIVGAKEFFRAEGAMRQTFKNVIKHDLVLAMEASTVPTLLLWGELDIIVPVSIAEKMHHVIASSELIIVPEADHGLPFKQAKVFAGYVKRFIENI